MVVFELTDERLFFVVLYSNDLCRWILNVKLY